MASSLPASVHSYLATCTPVQISAVLDVIRAAQPSSHAVAQHHPATAAVLQPQSVQRVTKSGKGKNSKKSSMSASKSKTGVMSANSTVSKRPLNSFIAFRSESIASNAPLHTSWMIDRPTGYYSAMFPSQQQKDISVILNTLWHADPSKAKWSILAKAYSVIRDHKGKEFAPLESFLKWTGPFIGLADPRNYLVSAGWEIEDIGGSKVLKRTPEFELSAQQQGQHTSNLSVDDIVSYCVSIDYISEEDKRNIGDLSGINMSSLSMAARPTRRAARAVPSLLSHGTQSFQIDQSSYLHNDPGQVGPAHATYEANVAPSTSGSLVQAMSMSAPTTETELSNTSSTECIAGQSDTNNSQFQPPAYDDGVTMSQLENNATGVDQSVPVTSLAGVSQPMQTFYDPFAWAHQAGEDGDYEFILDPVADDPFYVMDISGYGSPSFLDSQYWGNQSI